MTHVKAVLIGEPSLVEGVFHRERSAKQSDLLEAGRLDASGRGISDMKKGNT